MPQHTHRIENDDVSVSVNIILRYERTPYHLSWKFWCIFFTLLLHGDRSEHRKEDFTLKYFSWQNVRIKNGSHYFSAIKNLMNRSEGLYTDVSFSIYLLLSASYSVFIHAYIKY